MFNRFTITKRGNAIMRNIRQIMMIANTLHHIYNTGKLASLKKAMSLVNPEVFDAKELYILVS